MGAEKTIRAYSQSATHLATHVRANSDARDAGELRRSHVEDFLADIASKRRPATVSVRFRSLQQFFGWLLDEEEIDRSPMERMKPPIVPDEPVEVLPLDLVKRLLASCDGRGFADRRDTAIVRLLLDTGMRLNELRALTVDDVDLDLDVAIVLGKGRRPRSCPFSSKTATALDRYLRLRSRHPRARMPALWLAEANVGALTDNGIAQTLIS